MIAYALILLLISSIVAFARTMHNVGDIPTIEIPSGRGEVFSLSNESSTRLRRFR